MTNRENEMQKSSLLALITAAMTVGRAPMPGLGDTMPPVRPQKHRAKDANSGGNRTARGAHKRAHRAALKARRG